jgi:hypothetical protein
MAKAGLRKVTKTVRTKKGTVRRAYYVKAQGPQPKATLRSADASSGKAASRGRIIGAVLGSALGGTVGAAGGALFGAHATHGAIRGYVGGLNSPALHVGAANSEQHAYGVGWSSFRGQSAGGHYDHAGVRNQQLRATAKAYGRGVAGGAVIFGAGGAASGAVVGALMGHVVGRAIDRRRARK